VNRDKALPLIIGLLVGLAVGFGFGVHHGGASAPSEVAPSPAEDVARWQELGYSEDAARVLVTRARTGLLPSQVRTELAPPPPRPAAAPAPSPPRDPRQDCARLAGPSFESPADWERALAQAGEPWSSVVRAVGDETNPARRLDGLLAGFQRICPPQEQPTPTSGR
jgi:hypothetical protein